MTQAVEDGATRPVFYESRVIHLNLDEDVLKDIDREYDIVAEEAEPYVVEKSKMELGRMESILGAPQTIDTLCTDILHHYENYRQYELTGKAMIVAYSRPIALSIYHRLLEMRPNWTEKLAVVMTSSNDDPEEWRAIIGNKRHKEELAKRFKDNDDPLKIAIVVDMWLTGFDVPSLATMYVYKPMEGHNLMQAIARVNRVFQNKEGGLIVDYVGIARALKQAMFDYTGRDRANYGDMDIGTRAYPKFQEKLEVCQNLFHGFDYTRFITGSDLERAHLITGGVNFITDAHEEKRKENFIRESMMLRQGSPSVEASCRLTSGWRLPSSRPSARWSRVFPRAGRNSPSRKSTSASTNCSSIASRARASSTSLRMSRRSSRCSTRTSWRRLPG